MKRFQLNQYLPDPPDEEEKPNPPQGPPPGQ